MPHTIFGSYTASAVRDFAYNLYYGDNHGLNREQVGDIRALFRHFEEEPLMNLDGAPDMGSPEETARIRIVMRLIVALYHSQRSNGTAVAIAPHDGLATNVLATFEWRGQQWDFLLLRGVSGDSYWSTFANSTLYRSSHEDAQAVQTCLERGSQPPPGIAHRVLDEAAGLIEVTLTDEEMATLAEGPQRFVSHVVTAPRSLTGRIAYLSDDDPEAIYTFNTASLVMSGLPTAEELKARARSVYRAWLKARMSRGADPAIAEFERKRAEHRERAAAAFVRFREKTRDTTEYIPTLPFVPHGLASSRRWGIEVESGGARGVQAPDGWTRTSDGSLRSAWDGYTEEQDFEPYEETVELNATWFECQNAERHMEVEEYRTEAGGYAWRQREDHIPIADCDHCGTRTVTRMVHPQTITHRAQGDDCAEFVSPILVSMHSRGLEQIIEGIKVQPQNSTAGVHVHVEANDLTDKQIAMVIYGYDLLEPMLEASYRRETRRFCNRRDPHNVLAAARFIKRDEGGFTARGGERYVTTNTNSLSRHGTIEFRGMGPVYDYDYLVRWAMFCREMVNVAVGGATQKDFGRIRKWEDVLVLFARFGKEYVRAAVYEMTGDTGHAKRLVKEDKKVSTTALNNDLRETLARLATGSTPTEAGLRALAGSLSRARLTEDSAARFVEAPRNLSMV